MCSSQDDESHLLTRDGPSRWLQTAGLTGSLTFAGQHRARLKQVRKEAGAPETDHLGSIRSSANDYYVPSGQDTCSL